jgi:hypothetical protein
VGRPGHVVSTAAAVTAALAGLGGCGGKDSSDAGSAATSLPHASDTASARASESSDPILEQENPHRFIARWAAAEARMENTGKTAPYLALSRDCVACRRLAHTVAGYYAAGGFVDGGAWRIDSIKMSAPIQGMVTYTVRDHTTPETVRESSSSRVDHLPRAPVSYAISLVADGASYTVALRTRG